MVKFNTRHDLGRDWVALHTMAADGSEKLEIFNQPLNQHVVLHDDSVKTLRRIFEEAGK